ncbi:MAG: hypothetical protein P0S96_03480 [Simkaniaceae bacterium]|nr:hypothetical protein [Candidatus Sacchlamyda saccharinae]
MASVYNNNNPTSFFSTRPSDPEPPVLPTSVHDGLMNRIQKAAQEYGGGIAKAGSIFLNYLGKEQMIAPFVSTIASHPVLRAAANITAIVRLPTATNKASIFGPTHIINKICIGAMYFACAMSANLFLNGNSEKASEENNNFLVAYVSTELTAQTINLSSKAFKSYLSNNRDSRIAKFFIGKQD